jgi:hypothetical protein
VDQPGDEVAQRFRALLGTRHFVDRESGVLLVWLPAGLVEPAELDELVGRVEVRHPAARFSLQQAGAAVAIRMTAPDQDLAELEALYLLPG